MHIAAYCTRVNDADSAGQLDMTRLAGTRLTSGCTQIVWHIQITLGTSNAWNRCAFIVLSKISTITTSIPRPSLVDAAHGHTANARSKPPFLLTIHLVALGRTSYRMSSAPQLPPTHSHKAQDSKRRSIYPHEELCLGPRVKDAPAINLPCYFQSLGHLWVYQISG